MPRDRRTAIRAATAALVALLACSDRPERPPNLVILLSDTHRLDFTGYRPEDRSQLTPNIERIGREGLRFTRAMAPTPISAPSYSSLLTGLDPDVHGVINNGQILGDDQPRLSHDLQVAGYRTGAFVANPFCNHAHGFGRGFEKFWSAIHETGQEGRWVTDTAFAWLDELDGNAPFFVFVAYMDAHEPFLSTSVAPSLLVSVNGRAQRVMRPGNVFVGNRVPVRLAPGENEIRLQHVAADGSVSAGADPGPHFVWDLRLGDPDVSWRCAQGCVVAERGQVQNLGYEVVIVATNPGSEARETDLRFHARTRHVQDEWRALYRAGVADVDREVGRWLGRLEERGLADETVVVFVSDHGEMLGEHRAWGHVSHLYEQTLHVPLMLRGPGVPVGKSYGQLFPLQSLRRTLLDLLDVRRAEGGGASSHHPFDGDVPEAPLTFASFPPESRRFAVGARDDVLKLVLEPETGAFELYELGEGLSETELDYEKRDGEPGVEALRAVVEAHAVKAATAARLDLDDVSDDLRTRLEALGYLDDVEDPEASRPADATGR